MWTIGHVRWTILRSHDACHSTATCLQTSTLQIIASSQARSIIVFGTNTNVDRASTAQGEDDVEGGGSARVLQGDIVIVLNVATKCYLVCTTSYVELCKSAM